jgi:hypothetical protein
MAGDILYSIISYYCVGRLGYVNKAEMLLNCFPFFLLQEIEPGAQSPLLENPQTAVSAISALDDIEKQEPIGSKPSEHVPHIVSNISVSAHKWSQSVMSMISRMDFTGSCHTHTVISVTHCNSVGNHTQIWLCDEVV